MGKQLHLDIFTPPQKYEVIAVGSVGGLVVGICGLHEIDWGNQEAEIRIIIKEEHRGKGYGAELGRRTIRYGFEELHLLKLYLTVDVDNEASKAICGQGGFKRKSILMEVDEATWRRAHV